MYAAMQACTLHAHSHAVRACSLGHIRTHMCRACMQCAGHMRTHKDKYAVRVWAYAYALHTSEGEANACGVCGLLKVDIGALHTIRDLHVGLP